MRKYRYRCPQDIAKSLTRLQFDLMLDFIAEEAKAISGKKDEIDIDKLIEQGAVELVPGYIAWGIDITGLE